MEGSDVRGKGYSCLRFAYCLNGIFIGGLHVYDRVHNGPRQIWWSMYGDFGPLWHTAAVQLDLTSVSEVGAFDTHYIARVPIHNTKQWASTNPRYSLEALIRN